MGLSLNSGIEIKANIISHLITVKDVAGRAIDQVAIALDQVCLKR